MDNASSAGARPKAIDLFCGAGGMSLGLEQAGFDVVLGVDVDGHHVAAHTRNFPSHPALCASVADLTAERVYEAIGGRVEIDVVCGGPPCQGFSSMGLRDALDPRNTMVDHFIRLVSEIRPKAFVMENVPGMASGATKPVLDRAIETLEAAGYDVLRPVEVLDASSFGVPQKRRRLFLLAARHNLGLTLRYPVGRCPGQPARPTVWEAIGDLPTVEGRDELFQSDETDYHVAPATHYARVARGVVQDPSDVSHPRRWLLQRCTGCLRIRHDESVIELYRATPPGQVVPGHKLPRLALDGICPTLRAGSDSTHGSHTAPRPVHPTQPRCITAREAARLHGFPDWFAFFPTKWHAYRQIGNAVCPPVSRAVGAEILAALGIAPSRPTIAVEVSSRFELPNDRPRTLRRIPIAQNYPPVIARLFARAYDEKKQRLKESRFTFQQVQAAIQATGANLPWTRADTFVPELARSRKVRHLLASCLEKGYTIRPLREGAFIGQFVREGEPGSITDKDAVEIKSRDLNNATALAVRVSSDKLMDLVEEPAVIRLLWNDGAHVGKLAALAGGQDGSAKYRLTNDGSPSRDVCVVVAADGNLPTKTRIERLAELAQTAEVILLARLTSEHVAIIRFEACDCVPAEARRLVVRVEISATSVEPPSSAPASSASRASVGRRSKS